MNIRDGARQVDREIRMLRIIARIAPDISPQALLSSLAAHALFRDRTEEELEHFAEHGYFADGTPQHGESYENPQHS